MGERLARWIAERLPERVVYWTMVRAGVQLARTGQDPGIAFQDIVEASGMTVQELEERFEKLGT